MDRSPEDYKKIADAFRLDSNLDKRLQADEDLYLMSEFQWPTSEGKIIKERDYVTLNAARYFADRVIDTLKFSSEQRIIEEGVDGKVMIDKTASPVEQFMKVNMELADDRLDRAEMLTNKAAASGHLTVRGRSKRRVLIMREGDYYIPDVQWYDPRYVRYATSKNGLVYAMPVMPRSAEDIYDEYGVEIKDKEGLVKDLWTRTHNIVYIDDKMVREPWEHGLGYVPFVSQIVPVGGFIQTDGKYVETIGESVYGPVRDLYPVLNKLLTILMTYTRLSIEGAYQYESDDPEGDKDSVRKSGFPIAPGKVTIVKPGGGYKLIQVPDIKAATQYLLSQIEVSLQRATLPFIDYGQTPFELSGSAMLMIKGAGDVVYIPRLAALANLDQNTYWMMIDQYKKGGLNVSLGDTVFKYKYIKRKLDGDYRIRVKHVPNLPEKDLARIHMAAAMKELGASLDTILRDYLEMADPDGEVEKVLRERARNSIDALWMKDAAQAELKRGDNAAIDVIAAQLNMSYEELMSGKVAGAKPVQQEDRQPSALFQQREAIQQQGAMRYAQPPKSKEEVMV